MEGDLRDLIEHDVYKAYLYSNHEILVKVPAMSYSLLHDSELFVAQSKLFGTHCPRTQQAQDVDRN